MDWEKTNPNEPKRTQTNPISEKPKMNTNSELTKDYIKYDDFAVQKNKPNSNPIPQKAKMSAKSLLTKDYENQPLWRLLENKPNQTQFQTLPCKNGPPRANTVEVISLECTIGHYGKIFAK